MIRPHHLLFDWGDTLMADLPGQQASLPVPAGVTAISALPELLNLIAGLRPVNAV